MVITIIIDFYFIRLHIPIRSQSSLAPISPYIVGVLGIATHLGQIDERSTFLDARLTSFAQLVQVATTSCPGNEEGIN